MTEPEDKPPRRPRYRGTHPRNFGEKYKELQPDRYADDVARVLASGRTPAGTHRPILVDEILSILAPCPGDLAIDCTLGYGGHAREILARIQPGGRLLGLDVDPLELPKTEKRLNDLGFRGDCLVTQRTNFAGLTRAAAQVVPDGADLILADLGLSSMQLDDPERGFTYKTDAPLDMRMNPNHGQSAAQLLARLSESELAVLLETNADEPKSARLARAIVQAKSQSHISTTRELADVVRSAMSAGNSTSDEVGLTIRRVFQALRIAVNDEFGALDALLRQIPQCLKPSGRVAILTFHSGEDRRVKQAFKTGLNSGIYTRIADEVIRPTPEEQRDNPRSSSAKLRFAIRSNVHDHEF